MHRAARSGESWAGYAWFMTLGTLLPLVVFLAGYLVNVTLVGAPLARRIYGFGTWLATVGQKPPGQDRLDARRKASEATAPGKQPLIVRIRRYSPLELIERHGKPVAMPLRVAWFVLVGWWLGALWVFVCWSPFLLPYPVPGAVAALLADLPSVMTLAWPSNTRLT